MKNVLAILLALPVGLLLGANAGLLVGGGETGGAATTIVWLLTWPTIAFYASRRALLRRVFGRTAVVYGVGAFGLPVSALIFMFVVGGEVIGAEEGDAAQVGAVIGTALAEGP